MWVTVILGYPGFLRIIHNWKFITIFKLERYRFSDSSFLKRKPQQFPGGCAGTPASHSWSSWTPPLAPCRAWPGSRTEPVCTEPGRPWSILMASLGAKCSLWTAFRAMTGQQEVQISTPWNSSAGASWSPRSSPPCPTPCSSWRPGFDRRLQTLTKQWSEEPVLMSMPGAPGWWTQLVDILSRKLNQKWTVD